MKIRDLDRGGKFSFLTRSTENLKIKYFDSGLDKLNRMLGRGIPQGATIEIFGWEGVGKTTMAIQIASHIRKQNSDSSVLWIDFDHDFNKLYADNIADLTNFYYLEPRSIEDAKTQIQEIINTKKNIICAVIDSVTNLITEKERECSLDIKKKMDFQSQIRFIRKVRTQINTNGILICISQLRRIVFGEIGVDVTSIEKFLRSFVDIRIEIVTKKILSQGIKSVIYVRKNKFFVPLLDTEMNLIWNKGFI